jgi:hypothetical protein
MLKSVGSKTSWVATLAAKMPSERINEDFILCRDVACDEKQVRETNNRGIQTTEAGIESAVPGLKTSHFVVSY